MQVDMHYYGVYALARAAGVGGEAAKRIADASQFVDDYTETKAVNTQDGALVSFCPSGHGMVCSETIDPTKFEDADPHRVWVPFHFMPGNGGASYQERMKCRKDGPLAHAALDGALERSRGEAFAPELIGVMAHIYADTFSHWGFSGLRSDWNLADQGSIDLDTNLDPGIRAYIKDKADGFFGKLAGGAAEAATRGLGHASVADYPDRPYLKWSFAYENGYNSPYRDNPVCYLEACEKLFNFFSDFRHANPQYADGTADRDFQAIKETVKKILAFEGKQEDRCDQWTLAAGNGEFLFDGSDFPGYNAASLNDELQAAEEQNSDDVKGKRIWRFTRAVETMRGIVQNQLLPQNGLLW